MNNPLKRYWQSLSPALRRYYCASVLPGLLFIATAALHEWASRQHDIAMPLRMALALAPVAGLGWMFVCYLRFLRECDELERRIETDALAWAAGVGIIGAFAVLFMLDARLVAWSGAHVATLIMLFIAITYALVRGLLHRRYP